MGQVYLAQHRRMGRKVALKMLPPTMTKNKQAIRRFHREVQAAAKLSHPNVVAAFDAAESNGVHYLVMEHVEGVDLRSLVKKNGPLPVEQAIDYVQQAATGLAYAHSEGITHQDIKPSNVLLKVESRESKVEGKKSGSQPSTLNTLSRFSTWALPGWTRSRMTERRLH